MTWAILITCLGLGGFLGFVSTRPNRFRIERGAVIAAPPETIRPLIEDFRRWPEWSPWEKLDPELKRDLSGPDKGKGAVYAWSGAGKAGQGRMEILEAGPAATVIALDFIKPFKASNLTRFEYRPEGGSTYLVWSMEGDQPFMGKLMGVVFNIDKLVGKDFEAGLLALKAAAEAQV
jgi:hypothetical protein